MSKIPWYKKINPWWWIQNEDDGWCGIKNSKTIYQMWVINSGVLEYYTSTDGIGYTFKKKTVNLPEDIYLVEEGSSYMRKYIANTWFNENCNGKCNFKCAWKWFKQNPFHNFTFYVIGFADRESEIVIEKYLNDKKTIKYILRKLNDSKIHLPYIEYRTTGKDWKFCYIGWRDRNNFGIACKRVFKWDNIKKWLKL